MQSPEGWAFHTTARRFKLASENARRAIAWHWRELQPVPPDDDSARWLRADLQRARGAARYRQHGSGGRHA